LSDVVVATEPSPHHQQDWEVEIEELQKLICLLPASVRSAVEEHPEMTQLLEVDVLQPNTCMARSIAGIALTTVKIFFF
jgi:hypothetical protein